MEWRVEPGLVEYPDALAVMEARAAAIREGTAEELIWLVEHPPLYTAGTSATPAELIDARFPVFASGRGGRYTYHGPGQRVVYVMIDLDVRGRDLRAYVTALEAWVIAALGRLGVSTFVAPGRIGVWVGTGAEEAKIAALGVRVRRWVTSHGIAVNVAPDLSHFGGIVPCGLADYAVTSLAALGSSRTMADLDAALHDTLPSLIGGETPPPPQSVGARSS